MDDRRNWKCFIGMHQYSEYRKPHRTKVFNDSTSTRPVKQYVIYTLKCDFCGKIISETVYL